MSTHVRSRATLLPRISPKCSVLCYEFLTTVNRSAYWSLVWQSARVSLSDQRGVALGLPQGIQPVLVMHCLSGRCGGY
jgi:hypothetical protein